MTLVIANAEQIAEIHKKNKEAMTKLADENINLHIKYIFLKFGVKVGDIVKCTRDKKMYKITKFNLNHDIENHPWVYGFIQKKDGEFGTEHNIMYEWEKIE